MAYYPEQIQQAYQNDPRMYLAKMLEGNQQEVKTPLQGLSNLAGTLMGAYQRKQLNTDYDQKSKDYQTTQKDVYARLLSGDDQGAFDAASNNPYMGDMAGNLALSTSQARRAAAVKEQDAKRNFKDVDAGSEIIRYNGLGQEVARIPKGVSPDAKYRANETAEDRALRIQLSNADRSSRESIAAADRASRENVARTNTPAGGKLTEGERTAGFLLQRLENAKNEIAGIEKASPGAAKPELDAAFLSKIPFMPDAVVNAATSSPRQQVDASQMDLLDAALTLGTGAAYTKEQLKSYQKSYFPQIGDTPDTVTAKRKRLDQLVNAAKVKAGGAATPNGPAPGGGATVLNWNELP